MIYERFETMAKSPSKTKKFKKKFSYVDIIVKPPKVV